MRWIRLCASVFEVHGVLHERPTAVNIAELMSRGGRPSGIRQEVKIIDTTLRDGRFGPVPRWDQVIDDGILAIATSATQTG